MRISPAHAAAVSRKLSDAGIKRAIEIRKGWETEGYAVEMRDDHVRVEWVPGLLTDDENADPNLIRNRLKSCEAALTGYDTRIVDDKVAISGGWTTRPVLEVRRA